MSQTGFLTRVLSLIRTYTDEPATNAKYSDAILITHIEAAWAAVLREMNRNSTHKVVARYDIPVTEGQNVYRLPVTVGQILDVVELDSDGNVDSWLVPRARSNPYGPLFSIEANTLRFRPHWTWDTKTYTLLYVPQGSVRLHEGSIAQTAVVNSESGNTCTVTLASSPTKGSKDMRPQAYAGQLFRLLGSSNSSYDCCQEMTIASHDPAAGTVTLNMALDDDLLVPAGGGATYTYEIVPRLPWADDEILIALKVALPILAVEGDGQRYSLQSRMLAEKMRDLRLDVANLDAMVGQRFVHDTRTNMRYLSY